MSIYYTDSPIDDVADIKKILQIQFDNLNFYLLHDPYITDSNTIDFINSDQIDVVIYPQYIHPWNYRCVAEHFLIYGIKKPWLQLTWDSKLIGPNYMQYSYWAAKVNDVMSLECIKSAKQIPHRKYLFSCLNNVAKPHRLAVLMHLFNASYFKKTLVSMSNDYDLMHGIKINKDLLVNSIDLYHQSRYTEDQYNFLYDVLPIVCPHEHKGRLVFWDHDAYTDSYLNIVTEHDFESEFISEKSIKPLLSEQLAIFVAGPGTVNLLRKIGIDVFDDIIDHSYDLETNNAKRMGLILEQLDRMVEWDWVSIYQRTKERRKTNKEFLLSGQLQDAFVQNLKNKINILVHS